MLQFVPAVVDTGSSAVAQRRLPRGKVEAGAGTIFKTSANGSGLVTIAAFNGNNGRHSVAGLVQGVDGNFYGTTLEGGAYGYGTIFKMNAGGTVTSLASLNGANGAYPSCALIQVLSCAAVLNSRPSRLDESIDSHATSRAPHSFCSPGMFRVL